MGDRVSIQFKNGNQKSVVLFSHWGGMSFVNYAKAYVQALQEAARKEGSTYPLYRLEPETVMIDFIRVLTQDGKPVTGNYYIVATEEEGDNSDNGHHVIVLKE